MREGSVNQEQNWDLNQAIVSSTEISVLGGHQSSRPTRGVSWDPQKVNDVLSAWRPQVEEIPEQDLVSFAFQTQSFFEKFHFFLLS